jgi:glycine/D-amino acid oxidase-like deaminating enzyme
MNAIPSSTIVVVGAGVFGVTAALELRRRGHIEQARQRPSS